MIQMQGLVGGQGDGSAIGRNGQNVRLASQLTGWELNVMSVSAMKQKHQEESAKVRQVFMDALEIDEDFAVAPEINLDITFDGKRNVLLKSDFASADIRFGVQANYRKLISLRMGIQNIQQEALDCWRNHFCRYRRRRGVSCRRGRGAHFLQRERR